MKLRLSSAGAAVRLEREPVDFLEAFVEAQADWRRLHRPGRKPRMPRKATRTRCYI